MKVVKRVSGVGPWTRGTACNSGLDLWTRGTVLCFFNALDLWMSRIGQGRGLDGWTGGVGHSSEFLGPGGMVTLNGLDIWTSGIGHSHGPHWCTRGIDPRSGLDPWTREAGHSSGLDPCTSGIGHSSGLALRQKKWVRPVTLTLAQ